MKPAAKRFLITVVLAASACVLAMGAESEEPFARFDIVDKRETVSQAPVIQPWRTVVLDSEYGGLWVVADDLDGDGQVEIVSCENVNRGDVHHTATAVAQKLDGTVMWRWGDPAPGRKPWGYDVACQIHDWDGDGKKEVVLLGEKELVELDGATGKEKRRLPIPTDASDCIVFCNLSAPGRPSDILVKTRYGQIWAYTQEWKLLWTIKNPGGYRTAHQPRPIDLDGDGLDEIMAGYAMLNPNGAVRWALKSKKVNLASGHLDCVRVLRRGERPVDFRLAMTYCGANCIAVADGEGKTLWEVAGHHFESIQTGPILPGEGTAQILVDIDHLPPGQGPMWVFGEDGARLGRVSTSYARHHRLLDWTGDGRVEILHGDNRAIYDGAGKRIATLAKPKIENELANDTRYEISVLTGDMTGNGVPDIIVATPWVVAIYENKNGSRPKENIPLGTGLNFTLY